MLTTNKCIFTEHRSLTSLGKSSNLWIIMEYCPNGNIREFLRSRRSLYNVMEESLMPDLSHVIGPKMLIHFAWQISKGMMFLISRKVTKFETDMI